MFKWQSSVMKAILETDWTKMKDRVQVAESEVLSRVIEIVREQGGTREEREALLSALEGVDALRRDLVYWEGRAEPKRSLRSELLVRSAG
jgi:hypothetical protein